MADLIQIDTDEEMDKYAEAQLISQNPPPVAAIKEKTLNYNPITGRNDVLTSLSTGGYVKVGEEELPRIEQVQQYARTLKNIGVPFDIAEYEAAGFSAEEVQAAGVMPMVQEKTGRTEPLREGEELRMRREGADMVAPLDQTLRQNTTNTLREIFVAAGLDNYQARQIAEGLIGNPNATRDLGIGIADFTPAGLFFGAQEGYRTFERGMNTGDPTTIGIGALEAGLSLLEAVPLTATGAKAAKAGIPTLRQALVDLGQGAEARIAERGDTTLFSNPIEPAVDQALVMAGRAADEAKPSAAELRRQANIQRFGYDPNDVQVDKVEVPTDQKPGIIAFHGSGADFDEFKLEKIGTGEGAQAFGYGLYFTSSEDIAQFYKSAVRQAKDLREGYDVTYKGQPFKNLGDTPEAEAQGEEYFAVNAIIDNLNKVTTMQTKELPQPELLQLAKEKAIEQIEQQIKSFGDDISEIRLNYLNESLNTLKSIDVNDVSFSKGKTYQVKMDVTPDELLDYDKPFDEQSLFAQQAILKTLDEMTLDDAINMGVDIYSPPYSGRINKNTERMAIKEAQNTMLNNFTVVRFLNDWSVLRGAENSGEELLEKHGVKGIKYKANRGPGARNVPETGSDNYVIFDDRLIEIMKKYGIVGPVAIAAMKSEEKEEI